MHPVPAPDQNLAIRKISWVGGENRGRQPQGFSGPEQRPVTDTLARGVGAKGRSKRHLFNQISGIMIMSAAVAGAFLGYTWLGCFGAVVGLIIAAAS